MKLRAVFATARHERERLRLLPEHADPLAPRSELAATFEQVDDGHGEHGMIPPTGSFRGAAKPRTRNLQARARVMDSGLATFRWRPGMTDRACGCLRIGLLMPGQHQEFPLARQRRLRHHEGWRLGEFDLVLAVHALKKTAERKNAEIMHRHHPRRPPGVYSLPHAIPMPSEDHR